MSHRAGRAQRASRIGISFPSQLRILVAVMMLGLVAGACGGGEGAGSTEDDSTTGTGAGASEPAEGDTSGEGMRVALITPGPISDQGYNAAANAGLEMAKEQFGVETAVSENTPIADNAKVIRGYAADGFDIIIGHGEHNQAPMEQVAAEFPDVKYFVHAGDLDGNPSIASSYLAFEEAAYLEGLIAAHLTESNKIGFVGFTPIAVIVRSINALEEAAQTIDPEIEVDHVFTDNLVDPSVAREATNALLANGADVIAHVNGGSNSVDIIRAAAEQGAPAMGFPVDQNQVSPQTVATSLLAKYPLLVVREIESVVNGEFPAGVTEYGIESGVIDIAEIPNWVPDEARQAVMEARDQILSGELTVDVSGSLDD